MFFFFEICEKRPKHALHSLAHSLFRVRIAVIAAPLDNGWGPIGANIALLVNGNIFLQSCSLRAFTGTHPVLRGMGTGRQL